MPLIPSAPLKGIERAVFLEFALTLFHHPKFRGIIETGHCGQCGEQILSDGEPA
jgi:hypothetical protein